MARRRPQPNLLADLAELPWPFGLGFAAFVWVGLRYVLPAVIARSDSVVIRGLASVPHDFAPVVTGLCLIAAGVSAGRSWWRSRDRRRLLDTRTDLASVRALPWERFEHLVGEAYRRQGYVVRENATKGADGGVDLELVRDARTVLVQCKRWEKAVGVPTVRELLGAVTAKGAAHGILVVTGRFTKPAREFARTNGIELIDGRALERLIGSVRTATSDRPNGAEAGERSLPVEGDVSPTERTADVAVSCPRCRSPMTRRVAKRGANAGSAFLGCTRFPACRGTRPDA